MVSKKFNKGLGCFRSVPGGSEAFQGVLGCLRGLHEVLRVLRDLGRFRSVFRYNKGCSKGDSEGLKRF